MLRLALVAVLAAVALAGCFNVGWEGRAVEGSGTPGSRAVDVDGVEGVQMAAPGALVVTRGAAPLRIEGDDNLVDGLEVEVEDGVLRIRAPRGESYRPDLPLRLTVGVDRLRSVAVAGSGRIEADGARADRLAVAISGSGDLVLTALDADEVEVSVAGSGSVAADGRADRLAVEIAGSGDVDAAGLDAADVAVSIAGSGDVAVRAARTLDVSIAGSGDVRYAGSPEVTRSVMGSGDLTRVGD